MTKRDLVWALVGAVSALVPCAFMWGFTVDDALISVRYARHLAEGAGYRFNVSGRATDGVTPLPWPFLLMPFARAPAFDVLICAKYIGLLAWTAAASALGVAVGRVPEVGKIAKGAALATVALSLPVAAHAVSGMETGLAIACATAAALCAPAHPRACAVLAGLAAAFRPEMAPWALALGFGLGWMKGLIAFAPFLACALVRLAVFGRPAPLAVLAKPSDFAHGLVYAAAALIVSATPVLVLAPWSLWRGPRVARILVLAAAVHVATVVAVGGDWMPYGRLMAPIVPSLAWAAVLAMPHAHRAAAAARAGLALVVGAVIFARASGLGRGVGEDRRALADRARGQLADAAVVAAVDIGWVSAATEAPRLRGPTFHREGTVVDLAGVTDLDVAVLPGGHTSKRVDPAFLLGKHPDALVFYVTAPVVDISTWQDARYGYAVEARLAHSELIAAHYAPRVFLPLGRTGAGYLLLTRKTP